MTPAPISVERLRELLDKATPGPWTVVAGDNYMIEADSYPGTYPHRFPGDDTGPFVAYIGNRSADYGETDAQLIAEMREALPALLHQLAEREAEVYLLRSWLCDCFVNAGADTDGSTDVRALSERAVQAVIDLRRDYDENEDWKGRACAAERAREEATGLLRKIDGLIPSEILGTQLCEELDALLATSGGA